MRTRLPLFRALLLLAIGCTTDNRTSIEVVSICAPPKQASVCSFSGQCDAVPLGYTFIDLGVTNSMLLFLEVNNQLENNENVDDFRLNSNNAWIREYEIEYEGIPAPARAAPLPAGSAGVRAGETAVVGVPVIDDVAGTALAGDPSFISTSTNFADAVAHVTLKGVYANGTEFETGEFDVAIRTCVGCFDPLVCTSGLPTYCPGAGQGPASAECVNPE